MTKSQLGGKMHEEIAAVSLSHLSWVLDILLFSLPVPPIVPSCLMVVLLLSLPLSPSLL